MDPAKMASPTIAIWGVGHLKLSIMYVAPSSAWPGVSRDEILRLPTLMIFWALFRCRSGAFGELECNSILGNFFLIGVIAAM